MDARILLVEDDPSIREVTAIGLANAGFTVETASDGAEGLERFGAEGFDLVLLDVMLPRLDGLQICRRLRAAELHTSILMLTAKSSVLDRVLGLELGADDYLTKPFSMRELAARVKGVFRRAEQLAALKAAAASAPAAKVIETAGLSIDVERHEARIGGRPVELTAKEFELLVYFARSPGRVFTRAQLLDQVWGYSHSGYEHTVNSHINRLRNKIERDPANPDFIQTVWGVGYKFTERRA